MPATFSSICSSDSSVRSCDLPLGSPIMPVPPPTMAIGRMPESLQPRERHHRQQVADMEARRRRIESDVGGHALRGELFLQPFGGVVDHAAPLQLVEEIGVGIRHRGNGLLYQSMGVTRRAVLKTLLATGVGALSGTGAYGYLYGRHELTVTRANVPVAGLPPALAGLRIGLMTDVHRSQLVPHEDVARAVGMLMSEHPDLIVLGGDYVTWGDRRYVAPSAEALASLSAPHGVYAILGNHDDDHDMPLALAKNGVQVLKDARTRLTIRHESDRSGRHPLLDEAAGRHRGARARRRADDRAARARSPPADRSRRPRRAARAVRAHARRPGRAAGGRRRRGAEVPVVAGLARRDKTTMFVSRGVGTIYVPVRINCPPEVAVLTLQPA